MIKLAGWGNDLEKNKEKTFTLRAKLHNLKIYCKQTKRKKMEIIKKRLEK